MVAGERILKLSIRGRPTAKGRARGLARIVETDDGPRAVLRMITPTQTREVEELVRWEFRRRYPRHQPWIGPILLQFTAVFELPKSATLAQRSAAAAGTLYHTSKPDKDNIEKLLCDALNGVAWVDDAQLQGGGIKRYGFPARLDVTLRLLETDVLTSSDIKRAKQAASPELKFGRGRSR